MSRWVARWASGRANSGREEDDGEMALMDKAASPSGPPPLPMAAGRCLSPHTGCPSCHARASGAPQRVGRLSTTRARRRCSSTRGPALDGGCGGWD